MRRHSGAAPSQRIRMINKNMYEIDQDLFSRLVTASYVNDILEKFVWQGMK